jgi:hypothetical protein
VWFPLNYLIARALERHHEFFGDDSPSNTPRAQERSRRAIDRLQTDPRWRDGMLFFEYFNGDGGTGLGASHQTGWTALVADVIRRRHGSLPSVGEIIASAMRDDAELR